MANRARAFTFLVIAVAVAFDLVSDFQGSITLNAYHGIENWNERLYGNWEWYDHIFETSAMIFGLVVAFFVGRYSRARKPSDLPSWIQKRIDPDGKDERFDDELPSRKQVVVTGILVAALWTWMTVTP